MIQTQILLFWKWTSASLKWYQHARFKNLSFTKSLVTFFKGPFGPEVPVTERHKTVCCQLSKAWEQHFSWALNTSEQMAAFVFTWRDRVARENSLISANERCCAAEVECDHRHATKNVMCQAAAAAVLWLETVMQCTDLDGRCQMIARLMQCWWKACQTCSSWDPDETARALRW